MFARDIKESVQNVISKTCFPSPVTLTGTVVSSGTLVTGTNTLFLTEILNTKIQHPELKYLFLFDANQAVVREISHVLTNTTLILKEAFPENMASQAVKVPNAVDEYCEMRIDSLGTGNYVDGQIVPSGAKLVFGGTARQGSLKPIGMDGTPAGLFIQLSK